MDHATRHLSSPSPTSSFLFHHSEKSYKSSDLLTPLLSSEAENSDANACFNTIPRGSSIIENFSPNQSDEDSDLRNYGGQNVHQNNDANHVEVKDEESDGVEAPVINDFTDDEVAIEKEINDEPSNMIVTDLGAEGSTNKQEDLQRQGLANEENNNEEYDEDDDDEEDENMRNMLSGSSRSSATTIPLLTDAHTHHSFSERISLEEYSPLSLVNDCDNALPMSPTSLACGSHHSSFKSSLNNLKIVDHLGVDGVGDVEVVHVGVDDVVGDTRSMSPSLLANPSSHHNNHNNLWSNSSTAITQNPSLLTSTSTSILLSQHSHHPNHHSHGGHNHQMNTLMQQLEPQSLDESPPLLGNSGASGMETNLSIGQHSSQLMHHRPSSEPPLNISNELASNVEIKTSASNNASLSPIMIRTKASSDTSSRGSRKQASLSARRTTNETTESPSKQTTMSSSSSSVSSACSSRNKGARSRQRESKVKIVKANPLEIPGVEPHSSRIHLQLNHHKKLKELQQRLFGSTATASEISNGPKSRAISSNQEHADRSEDKLSEVESKIQENKNNIKYKSNESVDSPVNPKVTASSSSKKQANSNDTVSNSTKSSCQASKRKRTPRNQSTSKCTPNHSSNLPTSDSNPNIVKAETAEPDTTTKSSDCLKLADLLTSNSDVARSNSNLGIVLNTDFVNRVNADSCGNNERKIQHIQLQMNPSLTVVANNGLIQPINVQHQQMQSSHDNGTSNINFAPRQCQPNMTIASIVGVDASGSLGNAQLKYNIISNNEIGTNDPSKKGTEDIPSLQLNWPIITNNSNQCNIGGNSGTLTGSGAVGPATTTMGSHQIAIQVICQDGTSLVLPVSSATSLNTAISLSSNNQAQLQAILSNAHNVNSGSSLSAANCQPQQSKLETSNQRSFPIVSMISSKNQSDSGSNNLTKVISPSVACKNNGSTSGLAASSPTLAALLDAGSSRAVNTNTGGPETQGKGFIPTNLLRKIVNAGPISNDDNANGSGNCSALPGISASRDDVKRIKLEFNNESCGDKGVQTTTFTIIDPQGLIVTNGNECSSNNKDCNNGKNGIDMTSGAELVVKRLVSKAASSSHQHGSDVNTTTIQQILSGGGALGNSNKGKVNHDCSSAKQTNKMTSSTGNRQVDPAQPFRCEHCNSTFTRLGNFTRHKKIHTVPTKDGQRFKCDVCSKSFLQRCDLARHLHIHRGTEPHRCNICGKGYIRHSDLVTHQRFHNKEKPFGCPHCSKGFCQRGDLNRHLRSIHLQMKPILCPCCNRKFAKQETLLRHLNTAHRGNGKSTVAGASSNQPVASTNYQAMTQNNKKHSSAESTTNPSGESILPDNNVGGGLHESDSRSTNQKNSAAAPVASLQAIQATLCKVQQSVDPSKKVKAAVPEPSTNAKAAS